MVRLNIKMKKIIMTAPTWKRLIAFFIDYIILDAFVLFPFNKLMNQFFGTANFRDIMNFVSSNSNAGMILWTSFIMSIIAMAYFVILEMKFGQTIGKMIMKIFVIDVDKKKVDELPFPKAFMRCLGVVFMLIFPVVPIVDFGSVYFNQEGQRFLEKWSRTKTVVITAI